ncbi:unnamed protein product [marine sediment metagenome]|uniref:Uncharacterized protein n=1 Tax=marine sediment metagenome TaxID=412755 RepID=X1GB44_9ZZZZ
MLYAITKYTFGLSFYKAQEAAGLKLPVEGNALLTVAGKDKSDLLYLRLLSFILL